MRYYPGICLQGQTKTTKKRNISQNIARIPDEIRTGYLLNTGLSVTVSLTSSGIN
jgi:hypothetical protein